MSTLSIAALAISVVSLLLWVYTFLFNKMQFKLPFLKTMEPAPQQKASSPNTEMVKSESAKTVSDFGDEMMEELRKFSQMTRKNLEMLNTRVGIKFDVKPLSDKFQKKVQRENYVDSEEVRAPVAGVLPKEIEHEEDGK
ncbi:MAG: hypothetical protein M1344_02365 [Candidatus Thermoplasmatota archaeon]|nr:hypothetical protein [Candidatus Thermoplasmatota archaeon]MDA8143039.1 hypothetical protein [Thermoplasmatales archaeon]